jgi:cytochrome bd ubiquinol oxidase subunit II
VWSRRYRLARAGAVIAVASVLFGWGVAQWPYLIVPDVTVTAAAAPDATLRVVVIGFAIGGAVLAPSLYLLFRIFKIAPSAQPR